MGDPPTVQLFSVKRQMFLTVGFFLFFVAISVSMFVKICLLTGPEERATAFFFFFYKAEERA